MSAVCIIPARGGSRRIPRKNIKLFHGKPIIAYSIEAAKESGLFGSVWVSTEDTEIGEISISSGAKWYPRPTELAVDEVGTQEIMRDALAVCRDSYDAPIPDYACCIYPCAPMMTADDLFVAAGMLTLDPDPAPFVYVPGWFYWGTTKEFLAGTSLDHAAKLTIVEPRWIDIDTPEDWVRAELMYAAWRRKLEGDTDGVSS